MKSLLRVSLKERSLQIKAKRQHRIVRHLILAIIGMALTTFICFVVILLARTTHLQIEATTESVDVEIPGGRPIVWSVGGAKLFECRNRDASSGPAIILAEISRKENELKLDTRKPLDDEATIELASVALDNAVRPTRIYTHVSLDSGDLVIELASNKEQLIVNAVGQKCSSSRAAILDEGDGAHRGLSLPAQLRLKVADIKNALTLEFRGSLQLGNDLRDSRQALLLGGRIVLRDVRWKTLQWVSPNGQFETDSRELVIGDKIIVGAQELSAKSSDVPKGFIRISSGDKKPEMFVFATAVAADAQIVHPFSLPEKPVANLFARLWKDEMLSKLALFFGALITILISLFQIVSPMRSNLSK